MLHHLTVVEQVYHQTAGEQPTGIDSRFSRAVSSGEQPYQRRCTVGEEWQPLDIGWIAETGMILIVNEEGRRLQQNPTAEEQASIDARIVEIANNLGGPAWLIPPGESFRGSPTNVSDIKLRCRSGVAQVTLFIIPR